VGTVAGILLQGPYAAGLGLGDAFDPGLVGDVLGTRFGTVWALRLALLAVALYWLATLGRPRFRPAAATVGGMLLLTPGLSGHASTGQYVGPAVVADVVHLAGISVWLGGLAMLCSAVLPRRDEPLAEVVPRFSRLAFWAVIVIITSGAFQSWRQVRFASAFTDTTYGRLLLVKLAAFVGMVGMAAVSRRLVHQRLRLPAGASRRPRLAGPGAMLADPDDPSRSQLRRSVLAEVAIAVVVLSVTAVLVNSVPGREAEASPKAKSHFATLESDSVDIELSVEPGGVGHNQIHIYTLDKKGAAMGVAELTGTLALPAQSLGPLPLKLQKIYDGHWQVDQLIAISGNWELVFTARLDEFNQERLTTRFVIP
jgi:copper transport protein